MSERILFVDDDATSLEVVKRQFRDRFCIDTADSGEEGLAAVREHGPYAVIVADMHMPHMNGIDFLREVQRLAPLSVRMMLTGDTERETTLDAVEHGKVFDFLIKPCPRERLTRALDAGLELYHLQLQIEQIRRFMREEMQWIA